MSNNAPTGGRPKPEASSWCSDDVWIAYKGQVDGVARGDVIAQRNFLNRIFSVAV